jgi:4-hydroxy-tetrahydrodipicolinate synthase
VAPKQVADFYNATLQGDWDGALQRQDKLIRLHKALFLDASPAPAKFALASLALCSEECRLPITECADPVRGLIKDAMREAGV